MRLRPRMRLVCLVAWAQVVCLPGAQGEDRPGGLRTEFGEVRLQRLAIGKTYSVWRLAETALVLRNTSGRKLDVRVEVVVPSHHDLRPGAEPLPDPHWVSLERSTFRLPARGTARADVHVTVPYDPDLAGKTFQVELWSGTLEAGGLRTAGQVHRLLFTVEMDYRDDTEAQFSCRTPGR